MLTIKDTIIAPYEIDVDKNNFTLVRVKITEAGRVAGKDIKGGNTIRQVIGWYCRLDTCIFRIIEELVRIRLDDLDGQIISLKEFIREQELRVNVIKAFANHLGFNLEGFIAASPKKVLKAAKAAGVADNEPVESEEEG